MDAYHLNVGVLVVAGVRLRFLRPKTWYSLKDLEFYRALGAQIGTQIPWILIAISSLLEKRRIAELDSIISPQKAGKKENEDHYKVGRALSMGLHYALS
jgi:hypothetical protein